MPQRKYKAIDRYKSDDVQGEGSWVDIKTPTYEDLELVMDGVSSMDESKKIEVTKTMLDRMLIAWNWVDDDGEPMPQPTPEIIRGLPIQETLFLSNCVDLDGVIDNQKKSPSK